MSLARTIDDALVSIGTESRDVLFDTLSSFGALSLNRAEQVSAVATALVATARARHARHVMKFLDAVQIWSLEALEGRSPPPAVGAPLSRGAVSEAASVIQDGLDMLLAALDRARVPLQARVIAELTLFTRLLAEYDVFTVVQTIAAAADGLGRCANDNQAIVPVRLLDDARVARNADIGRNTDLQMMAVQGRA